MKGHREELERAGAGAVWIFGSVARNEGGAKSDVDILIDFARPVGLFQFVRLRALLERILEAPVDLVTRDALHPAMRSDVLKEAVRAA